MSSWRREIGSTVGKVVTGLAIVVGVAALVVTGAGFIFGAAAVTAALGGISAAMLSTAAGVLSIGASLLSPRPKPPSVGAGTLDRLNVTLEVNTPRKAVFGNTALANDMRDQEVENIAGTTDDINVHRWIVCAAHKLTSIDELWFEDELVWTVGGGVTNAKYQGFLTVTPVLEGNAANYINYGGRTPAANRRFTGCGYIYLKFFINSESPFGGSIPSRVTIRGKGMPTYDPRKDSTVTGGSGLQRADDCSTWQYDVGGNLQGENPACQILSWLLGWYIINPVSGLRILSVGKGIPKDRLNMASFITAANVCDESVSLAAGGSERRYRAHGIVTEGEEMTSVADRWKVGMNADLDDVDGQIRITSFVNDLGAPVMTLTEDDVLDAFEWHPSNNLVADFNLITGRFVNPSNEALYQMTPYPDVKLTSRDGIDRPETVDYDMVQSQSQCERLSKQRLQRAQYPGTFKAVFQFRAHRAQKGDIVNLTFGPAGLSNLPFRVLDKEYRGDGTVPMTLRLENASIYAWANNDSAVVTYAQPMVYSRVDTPWQRMITGDWSQPGMGQEDANLLKDAQFGLTYWNRTSTVYCKRVRGNKTNGGEFPIDSVQNYVAEITLGQGVQNFAYDKRNLPRVVIGRLYYLTFNVAKGATGISGTATVRGTLQFINDSGANAGSALNVDVTLANLPAGGVYALQVGSMIAPTGATKAKVTVGVTTNIAGGKVRIDNPKLLDKEPGADVTTQITGTAAATFNFDYTGAAESGQFPRNFIYKLVTPAGEILNGVTWTYKVAFGTLNGFTSTSGIKSMTGSGYGTLAVSSLGTASADVDIFASYNGKSIGPFRTNFKRITAPAPASSGGGSGGGPATQTSGFTAYSDTTFVAVTGVLSYTMPAGVTTAILSANLEGIPGGFSAGAWGSEGKWQRETSVGSGVWNDVGTVVSDASAMTDVGPPGEPMYEATDTAALIKNVNDTGRTAGSTYTYRFVARVSTGGTRSHSVVGSVSVTS